MIRGIHILGASGSGTTTLGQTLERKHGYKWMDTDDYFWFPTPQPYTTKRPHAERVPLIMQGIKGNPKWVITGSLCGWGDALIPHFDLVVLLSVVTAIRIERINARDKARWGDRIASGGDMYVNHLEFIEYSRNYDVMQPPNRCRVLHEEWLARLDCPILRLDGSKPIEDLMKEIEKHLIF